MRAADGREGSHSIARRRCSSARCSRASSRVRRNVTSTASPVAMARLESPSAFICEIRSICSATRCSPLRLDVQLAPAGPQPLESSLLLRGRRCSSRIAACHTPPQALCLGHHSTRTKGLRRLTVAHGQCNRRLTSACLRPRRPRRGPRRCRPPIGSLPWVHGCTLKPQGKLALEAQGEQGTALGFGAQSAARYTAIISRWSSLAWGRQKGGQGAIWAKPDRPSWKGRGFALASARYRLIAACSSTMEQNAPRLSRRLVSLAKKPSTALSHEADVGVK